MRDLFRPMAKLKAVLAECVEHYNSHRSHRSFSQRTPSASDMTPSLGDVDLAGLQRTDRLGAHPTSTEWSPELGGRVFGTHRRNDRDVVTNRAGLAAEQTNALRQNGYLVIPAVLDPAAIATMRARLEREVSQAVPVLLAGSPPDGVEVGVVHADLAVGEPDFALCHRDPIVAVAADAMIGGPWRLRELSLRAPLPGFGHQGLHPDYELRHTTGPWQSLSAMWCITPHTADAGPLRVIPGSHQVAQDPTVHMAFGYEMGPHPNEVRLTAPAGSLILFNGADLWHSGTFHYTAKPRLAVTASFVPCE
jgi:Phytanoyl-CoA dioxygenase (PhyH)